MNIIIKTIFMLFFILAWDVVGAAIYQCSTSSGQKAYQDSPCVLEQKPALTQKNSGNAPASGVSGPKTNGQLGRRQREIVPQNHDAPAAAHGVSFPTAENKYVNDYANVLSASDKSLIQESLAKLDKQADIEMTLLTIKSLANYNASGVDFDAYAANVFDDWGVGNKVKNDGVLILFSLSDRRIRVELGKGYNHLYDKQIQTIVDQDMLPLFKQGQYSHGLYVGAHKIINTVSKQASWSSYYMSYYKWYMVGVILIFIYIITGFYSISRGRKVVGLAILGSGIMALFFLLERLWEFSRNSGSDGGDGGFWSGGSGDGGSGDGSFGGGSSGGGGGGGSW